MTEMICARPTTKYPTGRTGTTAGYRAHRSVSEAACDPCRTAFSAASLARRRALPEDELARYRVGNAAAARKRRLERPDEVATAKRQFMNSSRQIIRDAKDKPCTDCGVSYPYYVMQFDHRDPAEKQFNIGQIGPTTGRERLVAEIAKCDVVCANCHFERTHQALQQKRTRHAS